MYPWNRQKIDTSRGPVGDYSNLRKPLDRPPKDMEWKYDETHSDKWILQRIGNDETNTARGSSSGSGGSNATDSQGEAKKSDIANKVDLLVEGKDYLKHVVLHDVDTFQGLCLRYKIQAVDLRRANGGFSGTNLRLAPPILYIPLKGCPVRLNIRAQDKTSKEYKVHSLLAEFPRLQQSEAKAYLELSNGDLDAARTEVRHDLEWEKQQQKQQQQHYRLAVEEENKNIVHVHVGVPVSDRNHELELEMKPLMQYRWNTELYL